MKYPKTTGHGRTHVGRHVDAVLTVEGNRDDLKVQHEGREHVLTGLNIRRGLNLEAPHRPREHLLVRPDECHANLMRDLRICLAQVNEESDGRSKRGRKRGTPHSGDAAPEDMEKSLADGRRVADNDGLDLHSRLRRRCRGQDRAH